MAQLLEQSIDQRITLSGTWEHFKLIQQGFEHASGTKLSYYEGTIEILMPGEDHEFFSRVIHYLVTTFLLQKGVQFKMTGAKTQEKEREVSVQADESYCIGIAKSIPDLSIEVIRLVAKLGWSPRAAGAPTLKNNNSIFSSGSLNKLARYQALGVPEVWFWQDGSLLLYHWREQGYERVDRSQLPGLEQLDIELLKRCILMAETDFPLAVQVFQQGWG